MADGLENCAMGEYRTFSRLLRLCSAAVALPGLAGMTYAITSTIINPEQYQTVREIAVFSMALLDIGFMPIPLHYIK